MMNSMFAGARLVESLRAGFVAYLTTTLLLTTVLTAYWAAHMEFPGHDHAPGAEDHVHELLEVGLSAAVPNSVTLVVIILPILLVRSIPVISRICRSWPERVNCARAPPFFHLD